MGTDGMKYKKTRQEYRELCDRKKKEENEKWKRRVAEARREKEIWEIANREKKRKKKLSKGIEMEEWKK